MTITIQPNVTLRNGVTMPLVGYGVFLSGADETRHGVKTALSAGYRLIDTAAAYGNEIQVGEGLRDSDVAREDVFVTTKMWISEYGYDSGLHGFERSLRKLGLETLDLYLLHQPMPSEWDRTIAAWKAVGRLFDEGRARAIGVSNFDADQIDDLIERTGIVPMVNQIEVHPFFPQTSLRAFHEGRGIATQAWSPIGGVLMRAVAEDASAQTPLTHPVIAGIASKYGRTPAQIILRWHLEHGVSAITKSVKDARIAENFDLFNFTLSGADVAAIDQLDTGTRSGPNPADIDTTRFKLTIED